MADLLELDTKKAEVVKTESVKTETPKAIYPLVEEMTFRGIIQSQEQGMKLLTSVQILVNEMGAAQIIAIMDKIVAKPELMKRAKQYLPYLMLL